MKVLSSICCQLIDLLIEVKIATIFELSCSRHSAEHFAWLVASHLELQTQWSEKCISFFLKIVDYNFCFETSFSKETNLISAHSESPPVPRVAAALWAAHAESRGVCVLLGSQVKLQLWSLCHHLPILVSDVSGHHPSWDGGVCSLLRSSRHLCPLDFTRNILSLLDHSGWGGLVKASLSHLGAPHRHFFNSYSVLSSQPLWDWASSPDSCLKSGPTYFLLSNPYTYVELPIKASELLPLLIPLQFPSDSPYPLFVWESCNVYWRKTGPELSFKS